MMGVDFLAGGGDGRAFGDDHQDAAAVGDELAVLEGGAHVGHVRIDLVQVLDGEALLVGARVALGGQHDAQGETLAPDRLGRFPAQGDRLEDVVDVALEERQDDFRLRVAEAGVELDDLDALRGLHQTAVQDAGERAAFGHHRLRGLAHDLLVGELAVFLRDERKARVGAHTARVRALVAVEGALVVLGKRHRIDALAVHEAQEGELGAGEEIFHHDPALAEGLVQQHAGERGLRFFQILGDDYAFAGRQAVILEDGRERTGGDIGQRLVIIRKSLVGGRGDAVFLHQPLGELLGALDGRGSLRVAEHREACGAEGVRQAGRQRRLRPDDRQIHGVVDREVLQSFNIGIFQRDIEGLQADTGVTGGAIDLGDLRTPAQRIDNGVFTAAAADDEDGFPQAALQVDR